jgi:dipeptidyl aminopeptidase/acylaminoacyl peptidase
MKKLWIERLATFPVIACCLLSFTSFVEASKDNLPRFPGQALLMGHVPEDLAVTVGESTTQIQGGGQWEVVPSISADGRVVASARMIQNLPLESEPRFLVGTYTLADNQWAYYNGLEIKGGSVAISPDGSRLACSHMSTGPSLIHVLDLKTGKVSIGPETTKGSFLTWSPDSRRLAFNKELGQDADGASVTLLPEIDILNVEDGTISKLADGIAPSWSPSGEWIAFSDYSTFQHGRYADTAYRVSLIHPNGTGSKVVASLKPGQDLYAPAIWSPDSKEFLLQRPQEDEVNPRVNIYLLNLATLNLTTKFRKTPEVYGWVTAR